MSGTRSKPIAYWAFTGVFGGLMTFSAALYLSGAPAIREALTHLGYPAYVLTILGTAKLIGVPALLQRRSTTLREWAYAGFTINLIGATASHAFSGDPATVAGVPALFLIVLAASYALKPGSEVGVAIGAEHPRAIAA